MERRARNKISQKETRKTEVTTFVGTRGVGKSRFTSAPKEIPMLYSTEMVKALLRGEKSETRRLRGLDEINRRPNNWFFAANERDNNQIYAHFLPCKKNGVGVAGIGKRIKCPYGQPGDLIWVRESFSPFGGTIYRADFDSDTPKDKFKPRCWTPSIHMPKAAARIWLRIKAIRVERLQDISTGSALEEGIGRDIFLGDIFFRDYSDKKAVIYVNETRRKKLFKPVDSYRTLWESINGAGSWKKNPWVWVVNFEKLPEDGRP